MRFLFSILIISFSLSANSQIGSAKIYLSLYFEGGHGLQVTDPNVSLNFDRPIDFIEGVRTPMLLGHLQITSKGSYEIWVRSQTEQLLSNNTVTGIPVSSIHVKAQNGLQTQTVSLSPRSQLLLSNPNKVLTDVVDVSYSIPADQTHYFFNRTFTTYQTIVTYTLITN